MEPIALKLEEISKENLLRNLPPAILKGNSVEVEMNGRKVLIFCSNNYLGLATSEEIKKALIEGIEKFGFAGATASRLVCGNFSPFEEFEDEVRKIFDLEKKDKDVLFFNSGWSANVGVISALAFSDEWEIFSDELNHASIIDGCRLAKASVKVYRHLDLNHLEDLLKKSKAKWKLVVTDSVFSMDGDIAPLKEIKYLCSKWGAYLYVDEAHAFGVIGPRGLGVLVSLKVDADVSLYTLSKSCGLYGAFVIADRKVISFLRSRARSFIFATALPPFLLWASRKALQLVVQVDNRRKKLWQNVELLKKLLSQIDFPISNEEENKTRLSEETKAGAELQKTPKSHISKVPQTCKISQSHIIPFVIGDAQKTMRVSQKLFERGFFVQGIRPPSVPRGTSRLRITCTSEHKKEHIRSFVANLHEVLSEEFAG